MATQCCRVCLQCHSYLRIKILENEIQRGVLGGMVVQSVCMAQRCIDNF